MKQYYLRSLSTQNFRNLTQDKVLFSKNINCIYGENGNGKTNLLEAIYLITNKKSFRKNTGFPQFLSTDYLKPEVVFYTELEDVDNNPIAYNLSLKEQGQDLFIDGLKAKKRFDMASLFINPFDSYQFHNSATFRRDLLNQFLRKLYPEYRKVHNDYKKAIRFRNKLLADKPAQLHAQLDAIEIELSNLNLTISSKRSEFLNELNPYIGKTFKQIFHENHELHLEIEKNLSLQTRNDYIKSFKNTREKELIVGRTLYGVHRDNFTFFFDGMNSFEYCSLGQQKMSYFSLIFAYIELFRYNNRGVYPIVLLDDVSGELDQKRWGYLIDYLQEKEFQVFITTANENFKKELERLKNSQKLLVSDGKTIQQ